MSDSDPPNISDDVETVDVALEVQRSRLMGRLCAYDPLASAAAGPLHIGIVTSVERRPEVGVVCYGSAYPGFWFRAHECSCVRLS